MLNFLLGLTFGLFVAFFITCVLGYYLWKYRAQIKTRINALHPSGAAKLIEKLEKYTELKPASAKHLKAFAKSLYDDPVEEDEEEEYVE